MSFKKTTQNIGKKTKTKQNPQHSTELRITCWVSQAFHSAPLAPCSLSFEQTQLRPRGSVGPGGEAVPRPGGCAALRAPRVPAGQRAAARGGAAGHRGEVNLVIGLVREPAGVAGLVAALAVGRVLRVGRRAEGPREARLRARAAGGAGPAQQHGRARLVQTHEPPLRLHESTDKRASEKMSHNWDFLLRFLAPIPPECFSQGFPRAV